MFWKNMLKNVAKIIEHSSIHAFISIPGGQEGTPTMDILSSRSVLSGEKMIFEGSMESWQPCVTLSAGDLQDGVVRDEDARG